MMVTSFLPLIERMVRRIIHWTTRVLSYAGRLQLIKSAYGLALFTFPAHTKNSASALVKTIQMTFPNVPIILVVAMASDKDHVAFAREFLNGMQIDAVFLTEVDIAGSKSRTTSSSLLKDCWIQASEGSNSNLLVSKPDGYQVKSQDNSMPSCEESKHKTILSAGSSVLNAMRSGHDLLKAKNKEGKGVIVVTGSLHIVSSVLAYLRR